MNYTTVKVLFDAAHKNYANLVNNKPTLILYGKRFIDNELSYCFHLLAQQKARLVEIETFSGDWFNGDENESKADVILNELFHKEHDVTIAMSEAIKWKIDTRLLEKRYERLKNTLELFTAEDKRQYNLQIALNELAIDEQE